MAESHSAVEANRSKDEQSRILINLLPRILPVVAVHHDQKAAVVMEVILPDLLAATNPLIQPKKAMVTNQVLELAARPAAPVAVAIIAARLAAQVVVAMEVVVEAVSEEVHPAAVDLVVEVAVLLCRKADEYKAALLISKC